MLTLDDKCYNTENLTQDSRKHSFSVSIAIDYSPVMAIWLDYLENRIENNLSLEKHIHDGLCWIYDTLDALCLKFPYFSRRQIERMINNSVQEGLVVKGNYNHTTYDRTVWYALTPKAYFYFQHLITAKNLKTLYLSISPNGDMDFTEWRNGFHQTVTTIPITDPIPDPIKREGEKTPPSQNVKKFPNSKERTEKAVYEAEELRKFFDTKFAGLNITYDDLFKACQEHYEAKRQWVTFKKWKEWLERERLDSYKAAKGSKPGIKSTTQDCINQALIQSELEKIKSNPKHSRELLDKALSYERDREKHQKGYKSAYL
jgi:hypothetical protein